MSRPTLAYQAAPHSWKRVAVGRERCQRCGAIKKVRGGEHRYLSMGRVTKEPLPCVAT